jgi:hypothetical protein
MTLAKDPQSRFKLTQSILRDDIETFGLMKKHFFLDEANLRIEQIERVTVSHAQAGRPWVIADDIYNSPVLDWVVVLFNKPLNPVNWPPVGAVIKLPTAETVLPNV